MFCRNIATFICIFVAAGIATVHIDSHSITESDPEVSAYRLTTEKPESSETEVNPEGELTVAADLPNLLDGGKDAIVTISSGDTHLVAHRAVLTARSPVLAAMLGDGRLESNSGQIAVPDVEGPVLRQLVAYLYTLEAPELPEMAPQLLVAADKFGVSSLKEACERQVAMWLTVENAAAAAALAVRHSCDWLRQAVVIYIEANLALVMTTQGWADVADEVSWLFPGLPDETRTPALADSGSTTTPEPHSDRSDHGRTAASAGQATPVRHSPPTDAAAVSLLHTPAPADSGTTPATLPQSSHSDHGQTPVSSGQTAAAGHITPQTDDVAVSLLHAPAPAASGATPAVEPHSSHSGQIPASHPLTTAAGHRPTVDDTAISRLRSMSAEKKNRRLIEAAGQGAVTDVEALLAAGADLEAADESGYTALHWAARRGHVEVAKRLLAEGAAVGARNNWKWTPLHVAAAHGHASVVRLLAEEASADPNARDGEGSTPLFWAAANGRAEAVEALLEAGADRGATDKLGRTPLEMARYWNHRQVTDILTRS